MTDFFVLRKRLAGTLTTPNVTEHEAGVAASSSTMPHRPRCRRTRDFWGGRRRTVQGSPHRWPALHPTRTSLATP